MENQTVEWKSSWRDEYLKWVCGFANAQGGVLEIGKDDDGNVVGLDEPRKLMEDIPGKINSAMAIIADVDILSAGDLRYIAVKVNPYPYPISYRGKYYYRSGSTNRELTGNALDEFMFKKQGKTWDGVPVPHVKVSDLDIVAFREFRRKALLSKRLAEVDLELSDAALVDSLLLADGKYLKRAAVLLFHENPEQWVTGAYVKIGYFETGADLLYQDEIHGSLITMADKIVDLVYAKYFKGIITYDGLQRIETYPVPQAAFREAILNAIVHRDYSTGVPIQIKVFPDEVIIYNDGRLPENWTVADLLAKHRSVPHNPNIANVFFRSGQIETWGRGIERIETACKEAGKPLPAFEARPTEIKAIFTLPAPTASDKLIGNDADKSADKMTDKVTDKVTDKITAGERSLLNALAQKLDGEEWFTNAKARDISDKSEASTKRLLRNLTEKGILEARGENKNRQYRLIASRRSGRRQIVS